MTEINIRGSKIQLEPINLVELTIIIFMGIALILAICTKSTDIAYGLSGSMAGYIGANIKNIVTKKDGTSVTTEVTGGTHHREL